jgi:hypothetical protein
MHVAGRSMQSCFVVVVGSVDGKRVYEITYYRTPAAWYISCEAV